MATHQYHRLLRIVTLALCAAGPMALGACSDNEQPAEARALWQRLQELDYRSYARAPGFEMRLPSNAPHSDRVDIYINQVVAGALAAGEPLDEWPTGSLIVKDGFAGSRLDLVAVMEKREDGWFWAEYTDPGSGEAKFSGTPEICIDCHDSGDDFVRAFPLP
jgi:hypothetical protein